MENYHRKFNIKRLSSTQKFKEILGKKDEEEEWGKRIPETIKIGQHPEYINYNWNSEWIIQKYG